MSGSLFTAYLYTSNFTVSVDPSSSTNDLGPSRRCYMYLSRRWITHISINIVIHCVLLFAEPFQAFQYTSNFTVSVDPSSSTNDLGPSRRCYTYPDDGSLTLVSGQQVSLPCKNQPLSGRYVTVRRTNGTYRADALVLCEVFVYAYQGHPVAY